MTVHLLALTNSFQLLKMAYEYSPPPPVIAIKAIFTEVISTCHELAIICLLVISVA